MCVIYKKKNFDTTNTVLKKKRHVIMIISLKREKLVIKDLFMLTLFIR